MENSYGNLAKFYDSIVGTQKNSIDFVHKLLDKNATSSAAVLSIACGTGTVLESITKANLRVGVDISTEMIDIAKTKIPEGQFVVADMRNFSLNNNFDVVLCLYDSINHLINFADWQLTFNNVYKHLNDGGIFIFDVNTIERLDEKVREPVWFKKIDGDFMFAKVSKSSDSYTWAFHYFEKVNNLYKLNKTEIPETAYEVDKIEAELGKIFSQVETVTAELLDGRVFFVCKK